MFAFSIIGLEIYLSGGRKGSKLRRLRERAFSGQWAWNARGFTIIRRVIELWTPSLECLN